MAYHRQGANIEITLRNDIITDPDVMILDVRREGSNGEPTCIINIYNQKALGEHQQAEWTIDRLARVNIDHTKPTIITGDWNIRHPDWDNRVNTAFPRTRETIEWIRGNGFTICNEPNIPTREDSMGHALVIDLTLKNMAANGANVLTGHCIDTSIGTLSNHHALVFHVGDLNKVVYNELSNNLNWKHTTEEEFHKAIKELLEKEKDAHQDLVSHILNADRTTAMPTNLDRATDWIQWILKQAATKAILEHRICSKSKPWWTPELTMAYKDLCTACDHLHGWKRDFHIPSILLTERVRELRKHTPKLVKETKGKFYQKMVEEADTQNIWSYCKWTQNSRVYMSPPID